MFFFLCNLYYYKELITTNPIYLYFGRRPFHNSNQDSKDYMLERTQSALNLHLQLSEAILEPSSADEDEDEDIEDDENKVL